MTTSPPLVLALALLASACSASSAPAATPEHAAPAEPSSAATAAAPSPREQTARKYAEAVRDPNVAAEHRGRLAMNGLSEAIFGLPADLRKAMEAVSGESVDPSQAATILMYGLLGSREASAALTRRCGKPFEAFADDLKKTPRPDRTRAVVSQCKPAWVADKEVPVLHFAAVLTAIAVEDLLTTSGGGTPAEVELARDCAGADRADAAR